MNLRGPLCMDSIHVIALSVVCHCVDLLSFCWGRYLVAMAKARLVHI